MITKVTKLHTTNYSEQFHDEWEKLSNIQKTINKNVKYRNKSKTSFTLLRRHLTADTLFNCDDIIIDVL